MKQLKKGMLGLMLTLGCVTINAQESKTAKEADLKVEEIKENKEVQVKGDRSKVSFEDQKKMIVELTSIQIKELDRYKKCVEKTKNESAIEVCTIDLQSRQQQLIEKMSSSKK